MAPFFGPTIGARYCRLVAAGFETQREKENKCLDERQDGIAGFGRCAGGTVAMECQELDRDGTEVEPDSVDWNAQ